MCMGDGKNRTSAEQIIYTNTAIRLDGPVRDGRNIDCLVPRYAPGHGQLAGQSRGVTAGSVVAWLPIGVA